MIRRTIILPAITLFALLQAFMLTNAWATDATIIQNAAGLQPDTVVIHANELAYDQENNEYRLSVSISDPGIVSRLIVSIEESDSGTLVIPDKHFSVNFLPALLLPLSAESFEPGKDYLIKIRAVDQYGHSLEKESDNSFRDELPTILATKRFKYEPELPEAVEFTIKSISPDLETGELIIYLDIPNANDILSYEGFINNESGLLIHEFPPTQFPGDVIHEILPEAIANSEVQQEYLLTLYLTTPADLRSQFTYEGLKPPIKPPKGLLARIVEALRNNPAILIFIAIIIISLVLWRILENRKKNRRPDKLRRPPIDRTGNFDRRPQYNDQNDDYQNANYPANDYPGGPRQPDPRQAQAPRSSTPPSPKPYAQEKRPSVQPPPAYAVEQTGGKTSDPKPRLQLRITKTPGQQAITQQAISTFPFTIGRDKCNLNLSNDRQISRQHVSLSMQGGQIAITDLGSSNGTFIDGQRLQPQKPVSITATKVVMLGQHTTIEMIPLS